MLEHVGARSWTSSSQHPVAAGEIVNVLANPEYLSTPAAYGAVMIYNDNAGC